MLCTLSVTAAAGDSVCSIRAENCTGERAEHPPGAADQKQTAANVTSSAAVC